MDDLSKARINRVALTGISGHWTAADALRHVADLIDRKEIDPNKILILALDDRYNDKGEKKYEVNYWSAGTCSSDLIALTSVTNHQFINHIFDD